MRDNLVPRAIARRMGQTSHDVASAPADHTGWEETPSVTPQDHSNLAVDVQTALLSAPVPQAATSQIQRPVEASRTAFTKFSSEILQEIGSYLYSQDLGSFLLICSRTHEACRHLRYRGWWDLSILTPEHLEKIRLWAASETFLRHAHAFKITLMYPIRRIRASQAHSSPGFPDAEYEELVTSILRSAKVTSLHFVFHMTPAGQTSRVCPDFKVALQGCSSTKTLKLTGLWHIAAFRELKETTSQFGQLLKIEVQGLQFRGADIHLDFFNHLFQAFPALESLELGVRIEDYELFNSLKTAALAAPVRFYKSLAILPYSITGSPMHFPSVEADIMSILLPLAARGSSTIQIGMNAPTFAELLHQQKYLGVQNLSLSFPLELHRDIKSTDTYLECLPAFFLHGNNVTALELITLSPYALVMQIATKLNHTDAYPFPRLLTLRIANPGWYANGGNQEKAEAQAPILREAMAKRGVTFEWENVERYPTPKQVLQEVSGHSSWLRGACI